MPETDIGKAVVTDLATQVEDYSVDTATLDSAAEQKETTYTNSNWSQQLGYYKKIPELKTAIDTKADWTVGKGFEATPETTILLDTIKGNGKDTFNSILKNGLIVRDIGGDFHAEIIRDKRGMLINLKPLNPGTMTHVANRQGRIIRFEQNSKVKGKKTKKFTPEEIFYLPRDRVADEIHGVSVIDAVENIILMRNEALSDWKRVLHRNIDPLWIIHVDEDDTTKLAGIKTDWENVRKKGENWIIPKGVIVPEQVATAGNATLNPLAWIEGLNDYFYETVGVPKIIIGNSKNFTDASSKIVYLAFEQRIRAAQLYVEEQVLSQLNLVINLPFPASLESGVLSGTQNDEMEQVQQPEIPIENAVQPNDTTAELEGTR